MDYLTIGNLLCIFGGYEHGLKLYIDMDNYKEYKLEYDDKINMAYGKVLE